MKKNFFLIPVAVLGLWALGQPCRAGNAGLLLSPTRVVLEGGNRYATVTVRNNGDAVGRYKIEIVDTVMNENGGIKIRDDGTTDEFSAQKLISLSPRSMTLRPDDDQSIRILIKNDKDLPDGEYRSHLQVRMTESDLDPQTGAPSQKGVGIEMKPKMTTVIPVIIRKGATSFNVQIDSAQLGSYQKDGKAEPKLTVNMNFSGNRSVLGDLKVDYKDVGGKETPLAFFRGIAIYRGVPKRLQEVPLSVPSGIDLHKGKILVSFLSQEKEGGKALSSKEITP